MKRPLSMPSLRTQLLIVAVGGFFVGHLLNLVLAILFRRLHVSDTVAAHVGLIAFFALLGVVALLSVHITRPLRRLTEAAEAFSGLERPEPLSLDGPPDVRRALQAFNSMGERISDLLGEKDQMLGALGHDLRTPLTSLRIRTASMRPVEEKVAALATIDGMARMIDDILTLARTGHSSETPTMTDVTALLESLADELTRQGANVRVTPAAPVSWCLRPELFRRAVANLVDNAVEYGGRARIGAVAGGGCLTVTVDDDGPGIPEHQLNDVLRPFARLDRSRNRRTGGAGLGLAISQSIARQHGGDLRLSNRDGGGLQAIVTAGSLTPGTGARFGAHSDP